MINPAREFTHGFFAVFRGFAIIARSKRLITVALVPVILGLFVLLLFAGYAVPHYLDIHHYFSDILVGLFGMDHPNSIAQLGLNILVFLIVLALAFASVYILFLLTKLLASPFYAVLALRVLKAQGVERSPGLGQWLALSFRTAAVNLVEVIVFMLIGAILFLFSFIPVLNILASFGFFLVMAYDSTDYSLDVIGLNLTERINYFFSHFWQFCGFALAISLVIVVPGFNLILFAASVCGSADLVAQNVQKNNQYNKQVRNG